LLQHCLSTPRLQLFSDQILSKKTPKMVVIDLISSEDEQEVSTSDAPQVVDLGSPCVPMVSIHVFSILAKYQSGCVIHNE
jgi:hypothetical protein